MLQRMLRGRGPQLKLSAKSFYGTPTYLLLKGISVRSVGKRMVKRCTDKVRLTFWHFSLQYQIMVLTDAPLFTYNYNSNSNNK